MNTDCVICGLHVGGMGPIGQIRLQQAVTKGVDGYYFCSREHFLAWIEGKGYLKLEDTSAKEIREKVKEAMQNQGPLEGQV